MNLTGNQTQKKNPETGYNSVPEIRKELWIQHPIAVKEKKCKSELFRGLKILHIDQIKLSVRDR